MSAPGWPAVLTDGPVTVRPLRYGDAFAWRTVRRANREWLVPWEATRPGHQVPEPTLLSFVVTLGRLRRQARAGEALPFGIWLGGRFVGQVTVGGISRRRPRSAYVGYWIDEAVAGRGIMPTALALVVDHCFTQVGLERVEANIRPENAASRRVVEKLGFRVVGLRPRFLFIDGDWRDHICFAVSRDAVPSALQGRWHERRPTRR